MLRLIGDMLKLIWWIVNRLFRSRASLEAEIVTLRHQLNVLRNKSPRRLAFSNFDRLVFATLYRITPGVLNALVIVKPATVIRWHRAGFRLFWRWNSRSRGGRPKVALEICRLIRDMSVANPLWGAPRIHGGMHIKVHGVSYASDDSAGLELGRGCTRKSSLVAGVKHWLRSGATSAGSDFYSRSTS
jgi:hypothetical protein